MKIIVTREEAHMLEDFAWAKILNQLKPKMDMKLI